MMALSRHDFDRLFGELTAPGVLMENRSRSAFPDRSSAELRASLEELASMVSSERSWNSSLYWLSPTCCVSRNEREAVGLDGEQFAWSRIVVGEVVEGCVASLCQFDVDDEEAAFAYAEERMRAAPSRLALTNRATEAADRVITAMRARDAHGRGERLRGVVRI